MSVPTRYPEDFGELVFSGEAVSVEDTDRETPNLFSLQQNYPNPFNPLTTISYRLPIAGQVTILVYDIMGQEIATLLNEFKEPGKHSVIWDAADFPSGIYLYRLEVNGLTEMKKMVLLK